MACDASGGRQQGCEADAEAIRVRDREVAQSVVPVSDRNNDSRPDVVRYAPEHIDVGHHHPHIGGREPPRVCRYRRLDPLEGRGLGEKETMLFPRQLDEAAAVPEELEAQGTVELDGASDV